MTEYPQIIVGSTPGGGKTLAQIRELVRLVEKIDRTDKRNLLIAENYNKDLQRLSGDSIGIRIWIDQDDLLRCIVVYPNSAIREMVEWWQNA